MKAQIVKELRVHFILSLFVLSSVFCSAQYFKVSTIYKPSQADPKDLQYPAFSLASDQKVADSINADLKRSLPFFSNKTRRPPDVFFLRFKVLRNDQRLLALFVSYSNATGYFGPGREYYMYDSHTGCRVEIEELFTNKGDEMLTKEIWKRTEDSIEKFFGKDTFIVKFTRDQYTDEDLRHNLTLSMLRSRTWTDDDVRFEPEVDGFKVIVVHAIDPVNEDKVPMRDYLYTFRGEDCKKYLSEYGKYIFNQ